MDEYEKIQWYIMCENTMRFVPSDANVKLNKEKKEQSSSENEVGKYES